jgi:hypothetical protein
MTNTTVPMSVANSHTIAIPNEGCFLDHRRRGIRPWPPWKDVHGHGWSARRCIPHGGHQMSLNIAAGLKLGGNESYPDVFEPFNGFADDIVVEGSYVTLPEEPGIGMEAKSELYRTVLKPLVET